MTADNLPSAVSERRVAIVTGAARGLGRGIAERLVADEMAVVMADIAAEVSDAAHADDTAQAVICDVGDHAQIDALVQSTLDRFGRLDLFVANAGVGGGGAVVDMTDEDYQRIVRVNLDGTFFSCRAAARAMIPAGVGCIVTIGSIFGRDTPAGAAVYGATKAGVVALTHALARELGPYGIRVNCISPGNMDTEMHWTALRRQATRRAVPFEQIVAEVRGAIPLGRHGTGADVGTLVSFLASDDASYITGQTINVDGGFQPM
jgi:NAD(P)-dependent dehydrogenase (short-subunit alcohol dehydrogenase family)